MSIKATIIGAAAPETGSKLTPTRLGGLGTGGTEQAQPAPASTIRPTAFKPTAMAGAAPAVQPVAPAQPTPLKPTAVPFTAPAPAVAPAEHVKASALPGTQRKPLEVTYETLAQRFPGTAPKQLERAQAVLAGISPQAMNAPAWLGFGVQAQEGLAALVKQRLALMESPVTRGVAQHLSRLHTLLTEVLDAMDGGFLKRSVAKVWESVYVEVRQLEDLLSTAQPALLGVLADMEALSNKNTEVGEVLQANAMAAEYLIDLLDAQVGQLLVTRLTALSTSQALVLEQVQTLTLDKERVQELMTLVQDGVLLQLPSVYSQLAGLSAKPSDTQRFLAAEKLTEIVQFIQRKL
ncbi:hypothetical protein WJ96_06385 [Burkholderia ubonensis]|uniref:TyeA family type III secretion system gatekeeper subunit n=1 Tax=Burkholderia ubonensis TaxID=101571 RepID=A0AAW3MUA3_9BURK|nr:hypothetical protein [Burkholderia ubonensis]KVP75386.1 hypothetical protein WJ93_08190 [Burkholderia ubonensis]KVP96850.1 hypothetical protein WJ97_13300 [Burkholderia ubonensis]KVP98197.1 hypothetical protein WJ96_06385 [Burkholderia ubonensis]KVZ92895.1 hypothetical protein WL25_18050 [Burkholderia ubonensis]